MFSLFFGKNGPQPEGAVINSLVETHFGRGNLPVEVIAQEFPRARSLDLLLVGVGYYNNLNLCPYEPYRISALLESKKINYTMTVVDIEKVIIQDLRTRRFIYLPNLHFPLDKEAWAQYLGQTGQQDEYISRQSEGLLVNAGTWLDRRKKLRNGFRKAAVPKSFVEKLESGDIILVNDDISRTTLTKDKYDFAVCMSVLYQLNPEGQQNAMKTFAESLKPNGLLLMDDYGINHRPVLGQTGGWMDQIEMERLGLSIYKTLRDSNAYKIVLLKKVS